MSHTQRLDEPIDLDAEELPEPERTPEELKQANARQAVRLILQQVKLLDQRDEIAALKREIAQLKQRVKVPGEDCPF